MLPPIANASDRRILRDERAQCKAAKPRRRLEVVSKGTKFSALQAARRRSTPLAHQILVAPSAIRALAHVDLLGSRPRRLLFHEPPSGLLEIIKRDAAEPPGHHFRWERT
jgi:hypothetical protein